ncbi:hypothetical protein ACSBR1_024617 [Camellia fascicularis]
MEEVKGSDAEAEKDSGALKVDVNTDSADLKPVSLQGYLVPADLTVGQFVYVVRKRIKLGAEKAIFVFVKNILPPTIAMMSAIYEENKDEDGFLYMTYSGKNTFGSI